MAQFKKTLDRAACLLLHLSEGLDKARGAFLALQNAQGSWAISPALAGIHFAGLHPKDFAVLGGCGGVIERVESCEGCQPSRRLR